MQLPNLGRLRGFRRADLTVFSISSWNLAQFPSNFLHIFKVSSAFHCILHLNIRFIPSAMHKRRGKLSKKLFWAPKYTLSQITQEPLLVILWDFVWRLRALLLTCSNQKSGIFAVVEARNAPCPMEWGCPKDRSMTVFKYNINPIIICKLFTSDWRPNSNCMRNCMKGKGIPGYQNCNWPTILSTDCRLIARPLSDPGAWM